MSTVPLPDLFNSTGCRVSSLPSHHSTSQLPLIVHDGEGFRCPGEPSTISRAIHLARLSAGWPACSDCVWRDDAGIDNASLQSTNREAVVGRLALRPAIRRTRFGVRGPYLNAIDRFRGAQLGSIFATHLASLNAESQQPSRQDDAPSALSMPAGIRLAIGYDERRGSTDVFAGVVSAVLQNGCDVVDAGRCTTASLLAVGRADSQVSGCLMVTGAGGNSGDVGVDVFTSDGRSVAIPWHQFGVGVRINSDQQTSSADSDSLNAWERLDQIRRVPDAITDSSTNLTPADIGATIQLPTLSGQQRIFRAGRSSGQLTTVPSEPAYLSWLLRWWPRELDATVQFRVADELVTQRLMTLATKLSLPLQIRRTTDTEDESVTTSGRPLLTIDIHEDDRFLTVYSSRGRIVAAEEIAAWMNRATRTSSSHVTAHTSHDEQRVLLVDVAGPTSGNSHEVISDGLAVAGFLLTLMSHNRNQLPA